MAEPLCGFWTPPGSIDELLGIGALVAVRSRVEFVQRMLAGGTSSECVEAQGAADELITGLNTEIDQRIREFAGKLRRAA